MRITLLFLLMLCSRLSIDAQDNPSLYAYVHNPIVIAPSFAGINSGTLSVLSDYRFIGIEGSPRTSISSFEYMLVESGLGLAVSWTADKIGPIQNNSLHVSTAYHLPISREEYFSFGMRHGLHTFLMNLNNERFIDLADISINTSVYNTAYYNLDLSGLYYSKENYFGATLFNAVNGQFLIDNYTARSIGIFGGGVNQFNRNVKVSYSGHYLLLQVNLSYLIYMLSTSFALSFALAFKGTTVITGLMRYLKIEVSRYFISILIRRACFDSFRASLTLLGSPMIL